MKAKTLPPKDIKYSETTPDRSNSKKLQIAGEAKKAVTFDGLLLNNQVIYRNYLVDELRSMFPHKPALWHVDKMVTLQTGKKLLIDEPIREWEIEEARTKQAALKNLDYKYAVIMPHSTLAEALVDAGIDI